MTDRRAVAPVFAPAPDAAAPAWTDSLLPVIGAIAFTLLVGNGALLFVLPRVMRQAAGAGLSAAAAEAQGWTIAFGIVAVSCSLGAAACLLLDMARRHTQAHAAELRAARTRDTQDSLTGLLRRSRFKERLAAEVAAAPVGAFVTLHLIDIEAFGAINDRYGQEGGDAVLRTVAARLARETAAGGFVGRVGADEFALGLVSVPPPAADGDAVGLMARLAQPVPYRDGAIAVHVCIGTRVAPAAGAETDALIEAADMARREAKRGGPRCLTFGDDLAATVKARRALEARLVAATAEDGFEVHYQPICHAADGRLWGYEALVRLPARGGEPAVSPDVFVPVAERLGLIPAIGRWVIDEAVRRAARWPGGLVVSINLSALQFAAASEGADGLTALTRATLARHGLPPHRLVYEITEGRHLDAAPPVLEALKALKALGVGLALDDFGTGYSTLAYLWEFPFDKLKIDASFVRALGSGEGHAHAHTVLATVVRLGHALGLTVTAEGVETEPQAQYLRLLGCDLIQGYLYGRPSDAEATQAALDAAEAAKLSAADAATSQPDRRNRAVVA